MRRTVVRAAALILCLVMISFSVSCRQDRPEVPGGDEGTAGPSGKGRTGVAGLIYADTGPGTVSVIGIENPERYDELRIIVPETADGKRVVSFGIDSSMDYHVPRMLTVEDFDSLMDKLADSFNERGKPDHAPVDWRSTDSIAMRQKRITQSGNTEWFVFNLFEAYFTKKSLSECTSERERSALRRTFPQCGEFDVYVLATDATRDELVRLSWILSEYLPSFTGADKIAMENRAGYYRWKDYSAKLGSAGYGLSAAGIDRLWSSSSPVSAPITRDSIVEISLPDSVTSIQGFPVVCTRVSAFDIPANVTTLATRFFYRCRSDLSVTYGGCGWTAAVGGSGRSYTLAELMDEDIVMKIDVSISPSITLQRDPSV